MEKDFTKQKEAFAELLDIMETLREKCPWDHKQTMESSPLLTAVLQKQKMKKDRFTQRQFCLIIIL